MFRTVETRRQPDPRALPRSLSCITLAPAIPAQGTASDLEGEGNFRASFHGRIDFLRGGGSVGA